MIQENDYEYVTSRQIEPIICQSGNSKDTSFQDNCGHSRHHDQIIQTLRTIFKFI